MAGDLLTTHAENCDDCGLVPRPAADPQEVLDRLPPLFNRASPAEPTTPPLLVDDPMYDGTIFGPTGSDDASPEYELARAFSGEKARLLQGIATARATQLGMGHATADDGRVTGQTPHAGGADLDRIGRDYGVGRPLGFTDCCYWRLVKLMRFLPGGSLWRMREACALFTGERPRVEQGPGWIRFAWHSLMAAPPAERPYLNYRSYANRSHLVEVAGGGGETGENHFYAGSAVRPGYVSRLRAHSGGLRLIDALGLMKPAGVHVELINQPRPGRSGCWGSTLRVQSGFRGALARGEA